MYQGIYSVVSNIKIAKDVYKMILSGDTHAITAPGQFVNIKLDGYYLRRPISICDYDENSITLIYKVVGQGTELMSTFEAYQKLDVLVGLGNGFDVSKAHGKVAVVGGGCGVAPMYGVAEALVREQGITPTVLLGFKTKDDAFLKERFEKLGCKVIVATNAANDRIVFFIK